MRHASLFLATVIFGTIAVAAHAADAPAAKSALSADQTAAVQDLIKTYLTQDHPEVVMQAMQELQKREQASAEAKSKDAIKNAKDKIYNNPDSPVGGNPKGDVAFVEFFDYQCGYCKMSEADIEKLLKEDKGVKMIYKDFPILGPMSVTAAKAALAAAIQSPDKYVKFHDAMMGKKDHLTEDMIYQLAKDSGLDVDKLKKDMASDAIGKQIQANLDLGQEVGVRGTPMFIIGEQVYPGALQYDALKKAVDDARTASKKN